MIQDAFHHQVRQHGDELISFSIEYPESQVNWVWLVGSADLATEQAVLQFFQTDVGKRSLESDVVEFKLASTLLRLPGSQAAEDPICHPPAGLTAATVPLQNGQEVTIMSGSGSPPHVPAICVPVATGGWLQVSPRMHFSHLLLVKPQDQQTHADPAYLRGWLVAANKSTVHRHVAAIVGARGYLVAPPRTV
ncbi:hypothetical protein C8A01DRAFT_49479 [Parachaetomium inaequale]|uniref:Uncharacterized protein n=1 Tax=Parachaetomium inaequale TaxID=2588326 RepID=A0AAN6P9A3_9PEZI|nr:hypothetical protein C8A01DRAFT_49479 [Parachaetomium inaequale]